MAVEPDLIAGTITLTNGDDVFTGTGTSWMLSGGRAGDMIIDLPGTPYQGVVKEITSDTSGVLTKPWDGPTLTSAYRYRFQPDGSRVPAEARNLIELLGNGNLQAMAGLTGSANLFPMFTGPGAMTLVPKGDLINGVAVDKRVNNLAERAAYDGREEGFSIYVANVGDGRAATYFKETAASGDWSDPAYVTGPIGETPDVTVGPTTTLPPGSPATVTPTPTPGGVELDFGIPAGEGFYWEGPYNPANAYDKDSVVQQNGSTFIAAQAVPPGEAPSSASPPVDTPYWAVLAAKGQDGDIDGVTPFWQSRILNDVDAAAARTGLGAVGGPVSSTANRYARYADATGKALADGPDGIPNNDLAVMAQATIKGRPVGAGTGAPADLTPAQVRAVAELSWVTLAQATFSPGTTEFVSLAIGSYSYLRLRGLIVPSGAAPLGLRLSQDGGATWKQGASDYQRAGLSVIGSGAPGNQTANAAYYYLNTSENIATTEPIEFTLNINNALGGTRVMMECTSAHTGSGTSSRISSWTHCFTAFGGAVEGLQLTVPGATFSGRLLLEGAL